MTNYILDKTTWVEVLDINHVEGWAFVMDAEGAEFEVSTSRLDLI